MVLALYIEEGEDELICDLAETYHILDYKALPPSLVATLSFGLSDDSRIKRKITGCNLTLDQMLLALITDSLQFLAWTKTKSAQHNTNRPKSIFNELTKKQKDDELMLFDSEEELLDFLESKRK